MLDALEQRLWIAAACSAAAAVVLGFVVAFRPPAALDTAGEALRGSGVPIALFFTSLGRWPAIAAIGVLAFGVAMSIRSGTAAVVVLLGAQVIAQAVNALLKLGFHRTRQETWLVIRESDFSYPSGHAATAVTLFVGLAVLVLHAPLPRALAAVVASALVACAIGIAWSRLALGAHFLTDVLGGALLGIAALCAALAVIARAGVVGTNGT